MKILFLVSRIPYELDKGDKLRAFHQLKYLSRNHEIFLFALSDEGVPAGARQALQAFCREVVIFSVSRLSSWWSMASNLGRGLPFQVSYFYHPRARRLLEELVSKHRPDHVFCQLVRMAPYAAPYHHLPTTLDYMDAFSKGMERRLQSASWLHKPFFYLEYNLLQSYEGRQFGVFRNKVIISEQDRVFIQHPQKYMIQVVPNGVDTEHFQAGPEEKKFHVLFSGNLSYPPNIAACQYLVQQVLPLVRPHFPGLQVLLAGKNPAPAVQALAGPQVSLQANLPDIREAYAAARFFVAPIFLGSGLQNKILEAMAMGLPCITTGQVNKALGARKGEQVLLAESAQGFAAHLLHLLLHPEQAAQLACQARALVDRQYNWEQINARLENLITAPA
ncbi:MAG: glycosyltransferase [Adhaeribacter sp.]